MTGTKLIHAALLMAGLMGTACSRKGPAPRYAEVDRGGDSDGDGAADIDDRCPQEAEDGLPPKANDGCPADDPDLDGIARAQDACPNAKEDGAGSNPNDGCPDADADGDGVADGADRCPEASEDNLAPNPSDGCPGDDSDGDAVADALDRCPQEAETVNGYRDDDGCPDEGGDAVSYDENSHRIYIPESRKFTFEANSAELTSEDLATLDEVANILVAKPELERIEIEGHASTLGDPAYNVVLTERRAISVAKALVQRKVEASRLVVVGYGEYCPVVTTEDEVDEPRNRRVELKVVVVRGVWQEVRRGCWRAQSHGVDPTLRRPGIFAPTPRPQPQVDTVGGA